MRVGGRGSLEETEYVGEVLDGRPHGKEMFATHKL
jgi:hypothetical protein